MPVYQSIMLFTAFLISSQRTGTDIPHVNTHIVTDHSRKLYPNDISIQYLKAATKYGNSIKIPNQIGSLSDTHITSYKGTDNSLSNAQSQAMKQIKKTSSEYDAKEIEELKKDTKTSPVYFRTAILSGKEMGMFDAYDALTVYFHNFKITPIYPMQQELINKNK